MGRRKSGKPRHQAVANKGQKTEEQVDIPFATPPASGTWTTDYAWICGLVGAVTVIVCAITYNETSALINGVYLGGYRLTTERTDTILLALVISAGSMFIAELIRLWLRDKENFFKIHPLLQGKGILGFLNITNKEVRRYWTECVANFLLYLAAFGAVLLFFRTAAEYGFARNSGYYQAWFRFIELAFIAYLIGGLPYVILTRAVKHDPVSDRRDFSALAARVLMFLLSLMPGFKSLRPNFTEIEKKAARALLVKVFFTPLMTIFFVGQFPGLVNYMGYLGVTLPASILENTYTQVRFNNDLFNISIAVIFSIDVALAWCGYVISSRWVDNVTITAEPTMLGWLVCILCYPPYNQKFLELYYAHPAERAFMQIPNLTVVSVFTIMMVLSYIVYMSATLWFGVRFSNLTNRGIIRKGPYALIRHPAYASKNFSWWCVMFPFVIYSAFTHNVLDAVLHFIGLVFMTWFYYLRAITEERHLSMDPYYRDYCNQVKYRFIPGVI